MTQPIFPQVDPATGALPAPTEARYAKPADLTVLAPKASPALSDTPTAPTATAGTSTTQIATTAFVQAAVTTGVATSLYTHFPVNGAWPARPAIARPILWWFGPQPTNDGLLTGGGGMAPGDAWAGLGE